MLHNYLVAVKMETERSGLFISKYIIPARTKSQAEKMLFDYLLDSGVIWFKVESSEAFCLDEIIDISEP